MKGTAFVKVLKKIFKAIDKAATFVIGNIAAIMLIFLILFTCVTIISRYLFNINMHGFEELPTMVFIVFVWLGTVLSARDDSMLKVPLIQDALPAGKPRLALQFIALAISTAALIAFTPLTFELFKKNVERGTVSPARGFSMWWVYGSMFVGVLGMAIYYTVNTIKCFLKLIGVIKEAPAPAETEPADTAEETEQKEEEK